jgi:hypothetical protein
MLRTTSLLHSFPFIVGFHGTIQMLVDGPVGEIVVPRDSAIRLSAHCHRIDLLMDAYRERYIPIILTAYPIQSSLLAPFIIILFFCDQLFQWFITQCNPDSR